MGTPVLNDKYDIIVAGGGITGAGIFHKAAEMGLDVLMVEARDFAWGTSSRSSKMVHGGLRYLKQGRFMMTRTAVKQRQYLLKKYSGLVSPLDFFMPVFDDRGPCLGSMRAGLLIYSLMAGEKQHEIYTRLQALRKIPALRRDHHVSAVGFKDAQVDDARLVLRLIDEGCRMGGQAENYSQLVSVERNNTGRVSAAVIRDADSGQYREIKTRVLINASGVYAEKLHPCPVKGFHIRPLRGSHLIFPADVLPLDRALSFMHPEDERPVFLFPWEGMAVLGTTDVDHGDDMDSEPVISTAEADYLMQGLDYIFPGSGIGPDRCISSIAGIRPVMSRKNIAASKESREHVVWEDRGLVTVTGGKLTTFRVLAQDALKAAAAYLPLHGKVNQPEPEFLPHIAQDMDIPDEAAIRIIGRYGSAAERVILQAGPELAVPVEGTSTLWAEIVYGAACENIRHLSDLLLRRVRIGLFFEDGGVHLFDRIQELCRPCLPWDGMKWNQEKQAYMKLWNECHLPPSRRKSSENIASEKSEEEFQNE
jgi:glycerol-3-phosphate dehydrogenase